MKKIILTLFLFFSLQKAFSFEKVVVWGHKLHSHTHSYVHFAFFRAFQELQIPVYWLDNTDDINSFDFSHSLFITEGQVDQNIPIRGDCDYILHNCSQEKYAFLYAKKQAITLQVYTDSVLTKSTCQKVAPCIYYDISNQTVYMPWATDLLPREIDKIKESLYRVRKEPVIHWVGTFGDGYFGNKNQLEPFIAAAKTKNIPFKTHVNRSQQENIDLIRSSYMAPAIVGQWQKMVGYIPCRIFKNISYGQMGITNSPRVYELFEEKIIYNSDEYQLFFDARHALMRTTHKQLFELMDFVRDKHTYLNRIETLLDFFQHVKSS